MEKQEKVEKKNTKDNVQKKSMINFHVISMATERRGRERKRETERINPNKNCTMNGIFTHTLETIRRYYRITKIINYTMQTNERCQQMMFDPFRMCFVVATNRIQLFIFFAYNEGGSFFGDTFCLLSLSCVNQIRFVCWFFIGFKGEK